MGYASKNAGRKVNKQDAKSDLTDWVADLAVDLFGGDLDRASGMSLPQLKLLSEASIRCKARDALMNLQTTLAATAACMTKDGGRMLKRVQAQLEKQAR